MNRIRDGFSDIVTINPEKIIFVEGLLWDRHIAEIFEISKELNIETEIYYPANDLHGNDNDIFHNRKFKKYDGERLLQHVADIYGSHAKIKESPAIPKETVRKIKSCWDEQKHLIDKNPASLKQIKRK